MTNKDVGMIINLGSGKRIKVKKIIKYIVKICKGGFPNFGKIKLRNDEQLNLYPSISLARSKKLRQKVGILEGLKLTISHYKQNHK